MDKVDIKFIAKKAEVSPATVSRVLNDTKPVSDKIKNRVMEVVKKYDYQPNSLARGLITKHTKLIAQLTDEQLNTFQTILINRMAYYADKKGYKLMSMPCGDDFESRLAAMKLLQQQQFEGIMTTFNLLPEEIQRIEKEVKIPFVDNSFYPGSENVNRQNRQAVFRAISYLVELGHKEIGGFFPEISRGDLISFRYEGFLDALSYFGCPINKDYISTNANGMKGAINEVKKMVCKGKMPSAIFCYCDEAAIGVMLYLEKNGIHVPQDISIIGFDGIPMGQIIEPNLTTIVQPVDHLCKDVVEWLICRIEHKEWKQKESIEKEYYLLKKDSVRRR